MAEPSEQSGNPEPITGEYFTWESGDGELRIHVHAGTMGEMARQMGDRSAGGQVEVGGVLLGHVTRGAKPVVWIERHGPVECEHRLGPAFALSAEELAGLEARATQLAGELNVVGFYRSHLRSDFGIQAADRELMGRYFRDPDDVFLLVRPAIGSPDELRGKFFASRANGTIEALGPDFPFRRGAAERLGRLVPDFIPPAARAEAPVEHAAPVDDAAPVQHAAQATAVADELEITRRNLKRRWGLMALVGIAGLGLAAFLLQPGRKATEEPAKTEPPAVSTAAVRPLGLYVDPASASWRISWNPLATALKGARGVQLFVRDGAEDQSRIELSADDLKSGTFRYQPKGGDVTFRLEVAEADGRVSGESFRVVKSETKAPEPVAAKVAATPPKAIEKVAPVVPAGVRPRIRGKIPVEVRVQVDAAGHVTSATPVTRAHSELESYLAGRAVAAAKKWKFRPARSNGKAVAGSEIIHFTFEKQGAG